MTKKTGWIALEKITFDSKYQARKSVPEDAQTEYHQQAMQGPESEWPFNAPVEIVEVAGVYYLTDGWQRCSACLKAERPKVFATIESGDLELVLMRACAANATHGVRRSDDDKRNAVRMALKQWPKKPGSEIAEICKVSPGLVSKIRKEDFPHQSTVTRKDGSEQAASIQRQVSRETSEPAKEAERIAEPDAPRGHKKGEPCPYCEADWWQLRDNGQTVCGNCGHVYGEPLADDDPEEKEEVVSVDPDAAKKVAKTYGAFVRAIDEAGLSGKMRRWVEPLSREIAKVTK